MAVSYCHILYTQSCHHFFSSLRVTWSEHLKKVESYTPSKTNMTGWNLTTLNEDVSPGKKIGDFPAIAMLVFIWEVWGGPWLS